MKAVVLLVLLIVVVAFGLKTAGIPIRYLDYTPSIAGPDINRPEIEVKPPGFGDFGAP